MNPTVAIVILNYNGKHYLQQFLPSVLACNYAPLQVVVADNASTDDSVAFLQANYPTIQVLQNNQNLGFAGGYNWALAQLEATYFVLLNSDVEVTPNWLNPIVAMMQADEKIGACQPKILSWQHKEMFEYAGASGGFIDKFGYPFSRGRLFDYCEIDAGQYNEPIPVFWATGAALFVRAAAYRQAGGLDDYFFAHMEEIDLCWRLQLHGYKIMVQPNAVVYHVGGGTLPKGYRKNFLNFRNSLIMLAKNLTASEAIVKISIRILLDVITAIKAIVVKDWAMLKAIFAAHLHFFKWLLFAPSESTAYAKKHMNTLQGVLQVSIVWQYFIRKKKTFLEIVQEK